MRIRITPRPLAGTIDPVISSKSQTHRALIAAALSGERTELQCAASCADAQATIRCLEAMGRRVTQAEGTYLVCDPREQGRVQNSPKDSRTDVIPQFAGEETPLLDCGESGSTLRFLLPVVGALGIRAAFTGRGKLAERPLSPLYEEMEAHGVRLSPQGRFPLTMEGQLTSGIYRMAGNVSSQFFSGLLMALPMLAGDSEIRIEGKLESASYVGMTLETLERFGIRILRKEWGFFIPGGQTYRSPGCLTVEGDWSGAAFWLAAGALSEEGVACGGLNGESAQGDRAMLRLMKDFGARVSEDGGLIRVSRGLLRGQEIDIGDIPDLAPALAVVAAFAEGETVIHRISRLRLKESDRVESVLAMIRSLGGRAEATENEMRIQGGGLDGGIVDAFGDHRIAMAAAVAGSAAKGPVEIIGAESVSKSYPGFFEAFQSLGGEFVVTEE